MRMRTQRSDIGGTQMSDEPNPFNQLATEAVTMHEMFAAYIAAGFTEKQAITLIVAFAKAGQKDEES